MPKKDSNRLNRIDEEMKKEISKISWSEVTDVDSVPVGKGRFYLSFISNKQEISVDITKKMYKALVQLCPNFNIIMKINQKEILPCQTKLWA